MRQKKKCKFIFYGNQVKPTCYLRDLDIKGDYQTQYENMKGRVRWNEANLVENEANKPVRQKISEPKTPFHQMIEEDDTPSPIPESVASVGYAEHAEAIRNALNVVSTQKHSAPLEGSVSSSSEDDADAMEQDEGSVKINRDMSFNSHRKAHYDEFLRVKELKQKGYFEDEDYDDHNARKHNSPSLLSDGVGAIQIDDNGVRTIHIDGDDEILRTIDIQEDAESLPRTIDIHEDAESLPQGRFLPHKRT
ncbi:protein phosphatase inhibitor 2 [Quercus suber]|uniref:Protein phosphatase inhibitor 2 n=2 Tax=Quercus suber TaxID=58331 RepID=A0AAW0M4J7_QUESU